MPDDCDIASGTSADCQADGVPDECQPDCGNNGIPDDCEPDCSGNGTPNDCEPDCNNNTIPDDCDITSGASADCQPDGVPDECQPDCGGNSIPDDCEPDCNDNGTPDDCEPDCNSNGVPDECDITSGTSSDCNGDGVPDECQPDCSGNGIPDDCEPDCNLNGFADDCDILGGTSADCDGNGFPDECDIAGTMFWVDHSLGTINRSPLDLSTTDAIIQISPGAGIRGMAVDPQGGRLYWADTSSGTVYRADLAGRNVEPLLDSLPDPNDIHLDLIGGKIYVATAVFILRANLDGTQLEQVAVAITAQGVAVDAVAGKVYWSEDAAGAIRRANLNGTDPETLLSGLAAPRGLALDVEAGKIYWTEEGSMTVGRANLDPANTAAETLIVGAAGPVQDISLDLAAGQMYLSSAGQEISRANLDGMDLQSLSCCFDTWHAIIPAATDCDADSVPDACSLGNGAPDCNGNGILDSCDIASGLENDADGNGVPDSCQETFGAAAQSEGSRAISLTPSSSSPGFAGSTQVALKLTSPDFPCLLKYVAADGSLTDTAVFLPVGQWGTVYVTDVAIVPEALYAITVEPMTGLVSEPSVVETWHWGDLDHNQTANFVDIQFLVQAFQQNYDNVTIWAADHAPCTPNGVANFNDILLDVQAFQAHTYMDTGCPLPCP